MTRNERAAAMRQTWLGDAAGEAVAWDELKQCVRARWLAVLDAAQPLSDEIIERMAEAMCDATHKKFGFAEWDETAYQDAYRLAARAALAAVGPQYCPADVAFSSRVTELEKQIAQLRREREDARREVDEVRRHISVTMSREHQARKEAQEAKRELSHLHPGETVDGVIVERDHYRIRLERAEQDVAALRAELAELRDQIDDDNTNAAAVNDLLIQLQNVTAERDEARAEARAAIAHLRKRPEGLPTAEELKQVYRDGWNEGAGGDTCASGITAILAALAPYLRDPVGWELDVTWQDLYNTYQTKLCGLQGSWEAILDLCRSRIRPVFECKECAARESGPTSFTVKWNREIGRWEWYADNTVRAALEGE